ncbi:molybdopterin converting factor subunit 1 [Alkalicoccus halolimnae]|uniref:Molybdopterin synthase sulfur carrier subunit n=1 Tax=Alkalicoccus halolimnae TaxID=1667239 RepID=A0A5C7F5K5_9BACI|nr:molybdopterin converting factor subunit 1 [Alkalicoccus halolimnae]TXF85932.1 molybdopterin converting factor subunit 1 [Alkalicoccus halolimnae]
MIKVLFFAGMQEAAGTSEMTWDRETVTVEEVRKHVQEVYPQLVQAGVVPVAVNEEFAGEEDPVQAGDTVAFIPPVSGG